MALPPIPVAGTQSGDSLKVYTGLWVGRDGIGRDCALAESPVDSILDWVGQGLEEVGHDLQPGPWETFVQVQCLSFWTTLAFFLGGSCGSGACGQEP